MMLATLVEELEELTDALAPLAVYAIFLTGIGLIAMSLFDWGIMAVADSYPRVFVFWLGVFSWLAGSVAMGQLKRTRQLKSEREQLELYEDIRGDTDD